MQGHAMCYLGWTFAVSTHKLLMLRLLIIFLVLQYFGILNQPLDTNMDLNIGTAFWFAASGRGYLRQYGAEELSAVFHVKTSGRPLLRLGTTSLASTYT